MSVSVGVAGLGRHGTRYAKHLAAHDNAGAHVGGVWTRDEAKRQRVAAEHDTRAFTSVSTLAAAVDAVVLVVPAGLHRQMALEVAAARKPLLIEKPLAQNLPDARAIIEAFDGLGLSVGQTLRFDPLTLRLQQATQSRGQLTGYSFEQRLEPRGLAWEDNAELAGGGVLMQTAIHTVDALRFVTGFEADLDWARTSQTFYNNLEDAGWMQLTLHDGDRKIAGDVRVSKISRSRHMRFCLYFEDGGLEADFVERALFETRDRQRTRHDVPEVPTVVALATAFTAFVRGDGDNPVPAEDAYQSLALIGAAYEAAQRTGG